VRTAVGPQSADAFTLVELIVVVTIIGILMMILFPTLVRVWQMSSDNRVAARLHDLAAGCALYKGDNRGAYPGQVNASLLSSSGNLAGISGSQMLAACMFNNVDANNDAGCSFTNTHPTLNSAIPTERYARLSVVMDKGGTYKNNKTDLMDFTTSAGTYYWTIADQNGRQNMPILYYPSRLGVTGLAQYDFYNNYNLTMNYTSRTDTGGQTRCWSFGPVPQYTKPADPTIIGLAGSPPAPTINQSPFPIIPNPYPAASGLVYSSYYNYIWDVHIPTLSTNYSPYRDGEFLLIAPGGDGIYGTSDDIHFGFGF
jgi:prepilin-type N-terminal cleavage/methylation domain-containing protein